jgi:large subunit ribosomal protein L10
MSIARVQKEENARLLREELAAVPHAILVDFKGLNVENATNLRRKLREGDAHFKVVKNTTVLRAVEELPLAELREAFTGQTAIAYTDGDIVKLAKVLREFAKEFETPSFKAGVVDGAPISADEFERLAELPSREELIAKALYLMNYPITGLVTALSGILRGFVVVLEQIRQKREEAGEGAGAPAVAAAETKPEAAAPADEEAAAPEQAPAETAAAAAAEEQAEATEQRVEAEVVAEAPADEPAGDDSEEPAEDDSTEEPAGEAGEEEDK